MKKPARFRVAAPVPGGYAYWELTDTVHSFALMTISKHLLNAGTIMRRIARQLNGAPSAAICISSDQRLKLKPQHVRVPNPTKS